MMRESRSDIAAAAQIEAEDFQLPDQWTEGRESRSGFANDTPYSRDIDDAISLTETSAGSMLHVSIADIGSFLALFYQFNLIMRVRTDSI